MANSYKKRACSTLNKHREPAQLLENARELIVLSRLIGRQTDITGTKADMDCIVVCMARTTGIV